MIISVLKIIFLNVTFLLRFRVYKGTFFFFFLHIPFYLKPPYRIDGFLGIIFKENLLRSI